MIVPPRICRTIDFAVRHGDPTSVRAGPGTTIGPECVLSTFWAFF